MELFFFVCLYVTGSIDERGNEKTCLELLIVYGNKKIIIKEC